MPEYLTCNIGDLSSLTVMPDPDWGQVTREAEESDNIYADIATQLRTTTSALRKLNFRVKLEGTDKDDLIAQENALRMEVSKVTNTLTLMPRNATASVTFNLLRSPVPIAAFDYPYDHLNVAIVSLSLVAEPWAYGPEVDLYTAESLTSPALLSLGTLVGQGDPRLGVTITRGWGTASDGVGIQYAVAALCNGDAVTDYFFEAESGDMTGDFDSDDTVLNPSGGAAAKLPSATTTSWTYLNSVVSPTTLPVGRYRCLVRAKTSSSDGDNYVGMRKITDTGRDPKTTRELDTFWQWHDLGDWVNYGGNSLRLYGKSGSASLWIDCVLMVPVDWGFVWYTDDTENTDSVTFGWLPYEMEYVSTAAAEGSAAARVQGHGLKAPLSGFSLLMLVEPNGSDPDPAFTVDVSYVPRWEMWRNPSGGSGS